ncbi:MAG: hypothetical protein H0T75_07615, partial [Rhizobiales bacterium]|nr:hypothetical protein [Hyphomicrobiales bacterium]
AQVAEIVEEITKLNRVCDELICMYMGKRSMLLPFNEFSGQRIEMPDIMKISIEIDRLASSIAKREVIVGRTDVLGNFRSAANMIGVFRFQDIQFHIINQWATFYSRYTSLNSDPPSDTSLSLANSILAYGDLDVGLIAQRIDELRRKAHNIESRSTPFQFIPASFLEIQLLINPETVINIEKKNLEGMEETLARAKEWLAKNSATAVK